MAIKDQVLALKWISANIEHFGGDRDNIVLFGHSSGASSVNLHMISPQTNNLFQKAIMMSGSALNPFLPRIQDHSSILYNLGNLNVFLFQIFLNISIHTIYCYAKLKICIIPSRINLI